MREEPILHWRMWVMEIQIVLKRDQRRAFPANSFAANLGKCMAFVLFYVLSSVIETSCDEDQKLENWAKFFPNASINFNGVLADSAFRSKLSPIVQILPNAPASIYY